MAASTAAPEAQAALIHQVSWQESSLLRGGALLRSQRSHSLHIAHHLRLALICAFSMNARCAGGLPWTFVEDLRCLQKSETFVIQWNSARVGTEMREPFKWIKMNSWCQVPEACPRRVWVKSSRLDLLWFSRLNCGEAAPNHAAMTGFFVPVVVSLRKCTP